MFRRLKGVQLGPAAYLVRASSHNLIPNIKVQNFEITPSHIKLTTGSEKAQKSTNTQIQNIEIKAERCSHGLKPV